MYKRFHWDETIRYDETLLCYEHHPQFPDGSKVFVGSTMELFGDWIDPKWLSDIFRDCWSRYPKVTFIFLTKQPQNLPHEFPDNCWVGVSATDEFDFMRHFNALTKVKATVKFWSFEPLLRWQGCQGFSELLEQSSNWVIIGQQTPPSAKTMPSIKSITQIMTAADDVGIPIFLKNNLKAFLPFRQHYTDDYHDKCYELRQEFPIVKETL
jgi:protein gp37